MHKLAMYHTNSSDYRVIALPFPHNFVFQLSVENVKRFSLVNSTIAYLPSEGEMIVLMKCPEREQRWRGTIDGRGQSVTIGCVYREVIAALFVRGRGINEYAGN